MLSSEFLLKAVAAPLIAGFAATLVSMRLSTGRRGAAALGLLAGQTLGMALLLSAHEDWFPDRNSEWVPWMTVGASIIGPMLAAIGLTRIERWLLALLASLAAAALIVPTWPDLWPARWISLPAVTAAFTLMARGLGGVARRGLSRVVVVATAVTAFVASMLIAASLSLMLGQAALITAASLAGVAAVLLIRPSEEAVQGIAFPYAVGIGGWCYVAAIELPPPSPPLLALTLIPLAPLVLWAVCVGPLARKSDRVRSTLGAILVLGFLAAAGTWAWMSTESPGDEYAQL